MLPSDMLNNLPAVLPLVRMARVLKVKPEALQKLADAGTVPSVRIGADLLFNPQAVLQALARLARGTAATGQRPLGEVSTR